MKELVVIKGAGDIATGIAHRLHRSGFAVVMTELPLPTVIRRTAAFAEAVFAEQTVVEGVTAVRTEVADALKAVARGRVAVVVDPEAAAVRVLNPLAVVDAIIAKKNTGTKLGDAPIVIGVGPGFVAGRDVHAVVETARGHYLGRVIDQGAALPDTGTPGAIAGYAKERIIRAPRQGVFKAARRIGDPVAAGDVIGAVDGAPVRAELSGVLRGLLHDGLAVAAGMKIGDIDPRGVPEYCYSISDKARAVGGGVLEAIFLRSAGLRVFGAGCRQAAEPARC
ncbi:MAG TPA: selenium-dependent molybdenum cofactor biosynthesis protein YqeB [Selenomonadales bacterium]|nr:selenium-dependent molybdenum cofactor biosynthesis protein YqeB [Selenomonadales bacterium]